MEASEIQDKVIEEIKLVPKERLPEIFNFIHFFRIGLKSVENAPSEIMRFAGCWQDMTDEEFKELSDEIVTRRRQTFSRKTLETIVD